MVKKNFVFIIILILIVPTLVNASTNTYERTSDNLRIPDKITYKDSMYNNVMNTPSIDATEKVYDFADLFTDSEEEELYGEINNFIDTTNLDFAVVTIEDNTKQSTREYADDFYDYNDFDIDGLVYVIDMDNREFYISTAGSAILYYDDYRIESILTSMDYSMGNANYKDSVDIMIEKLSSYYERGYSSTSSKYTLDNGVLVYKTPYLILIVISLIVSSITTLILVKRNKPVKLATDSNIYLAPNGIKITNSKEEFINTHTTSHYNPPVDHSSGGGGGGSSHSGSSGMSHGGGGHHF